MFDLVFFDLFIDGDFYFMSQCFSVDNFVIVEVIIQVFNIDEVGVELVIKSVDEVFSKLK